MNPIQTNQIFSLEFYIKDSIHWNQFHTLTHVLAQKCFKQSNELLVSLFTPIPKYCLIWQRTQTHSMWSQFQRSEVDSQFPNLLKELSRHPLPALVADRSGGSLLSNFINVLFKTYSKCCVGERKLIETTSLSVTHYETNEGRMRMNSLISCWQTPKCLYIRVVCSAVIILNRL